MVNFFIGRPIFATVLALLMLLVGGICIFVLPISLYPDIVPPQVQVTTTYTGADAQTVADTVTTPIEQQINGVKGQIYFNSDSTSNGLANIIATFDVGYDQDIAAVDIQNKVSTAQTSLPPEVKQYGVTVKKTSTNMVCVVNLVSPDGRYDATFLDNYSQINVVDALKRIPGVSDVNPFGRKYAMRVWLDPDRMANQRISPAEVIQAIQQENKQAASGKIGALPAPPGQRFEYPVKAKGRLTKVEEFEKIVVRRNDDGSIVYLSNVARVQLDSENYETAGWLNGKPAGTIPIYQLSDANALDIVKQVRQEMDRVARNFPEGLEYKIAYDTTLYVRENITEVWDTLIEAFILVLIVVFVFLQGFRATAIPMIAIPVSLVATFAMMAAFGFSINTLTMCGLVLAIGLVVDDAIIVVENIEKFLERGMGPLEATRAAMAEITAPIVTIGLVLAAVFVPVAFIPGLDRPALQPVRPHDRLLLPLLGLQLADVHPGDRPDRPAAQARRDQVPAVSMVQSRPEVDRGLLRLVPRLRSPPLVDHRLPLARPARADWLADLQAPEGVHPDRGPGLSDRCPADTGWHYPGADQPGCPTRRQDRRGAARCSRRPASRRLQRRHRHQSDQHRHRIRHARRMGPQDHAGTAGRGSGEGTPAQAFRADPRRAGGGPPASAHPGAELDRRLRLHDRGPRRQRGRGHGLGHRAVPRRGQESPRTRGGLHLLLGASRSCSSRSIASRHAGSTYRSPTYSAFSRPTWGPTTSTTSTCMARPGKSSSRQRRTTATDPTTFLACTS